MKHQPDQPNRKPLCSLQTVVTKRKSGEGGLNRDRGGHQKEKSREPMNLRTTTWKNTPTRWPPWAILTRWCRCNTSKNVTQQSIIAPPQPRVLHLWEQTFGYEGGEAADLKTRGETTESFF